MKPRDFIRYLMDMAISKYQRLKRILWITILGSLLVFGISISTTLLESWVNLTYQNRHVLIPFRKSDASYLDEISTQLISPYYLKDISNKFDNTSIKSSNKIMNIEATNMRTHRNGTLSFDIRNQSYLSVQESLMEYYDWKINDILKIGNTVYPIYATHISEAVDLYMPFHFLNSPSTQLNYDNILTVSTLDSIDALVDAINLHLIESNYYYELEPFSMDDLLLSLIYLIRRILMAISLCVFLVSSSNIGTLMPYFIMEYKDEMEVLRIHGMPKHILSNLFVVFTVLILLCAMLLSVLSISFIFKILSYLIKVPFKLPLFKLIILAFIQVSFATLLTLGSIKKAMDTITYI